MHTMLTIRHASLTPAERRRLSEINERLRRYFRSVLTIRWVINQVGHIYAVTMEVHARSGYYLARSHADRLAKSVDQAFDKIVRQRRRNRVATLTTRRRRGLAAKRILTTLGNANTAAENNDVHAGVFVPKDIET